MTITGPIDATTSPAFKDTLRVLIIVPDGHEADALSKTVREAGYSIRATHLASPTDLAGVLLTQAPELILQRIEYAPLTLEHTLHELRTLRRATPVIALSSNPKLDPAVYMAHGAEDLVILPNFKHLKLVIRRVANALRHQRDLAALRDTNHDLGHRYTSLLDQTELPLAYLSDGIHVYANPAYLEFFRIDRDDLICLPFLDLIPVEERDKFKLFMQRFRHSDGSRDTLEGKIVQDEQAIRCTFEVANASFEGERCLQITIRAFRNNSVITRELSYLSIYDVSSGLYTRTHLLNQLEKAVEQSRVLGEHSAFVLMTIDNHGELEERLGAIPMDVLYADIGATLKSRISLDDMLCRFDAFSYGLLTTLTDPAQLEQFVTRLLHSVNDQLFELDGRVVPCQINAGIAILDLTLNSAHEVVEQATIALQCAVRKSTGVERYRVSASDKPQKVIDDEWMEQLRLAFKENRLRLTFQPIVRLHADQLQRYSVLLRIARPDGGYIFPAEFMPSAERSGYAKGLDRWVIINTLRECTQRKNTDHRLFIKLTENTLKQEEDFLWIHNQIREHEVDPSQLVFELKANSLLVCLQQVKRLLEYLRPLGARFAVSDFGNSLNPFQVLRHLHVDYLKLDPFFTESIERDQDRQKALQRLTREARVLGKEVIAQQVEREEQFLTLKRLGVDYVQGFYLRQPAEDLEFDFSANAQLLS